MRTSWWENSIAALIEKFCSLSKQASLILFETLLLLIEMMTKPNLDLRAAFFCIYRPKIKMYLKYKDSDYHSL